MPGTSWRRWVARLLRARPGQQQRYRTRLSIEQVEARLCLSPASVLAAGGLATGNATPVQAGRLAPNPPAPDLNAVAPGRGAVGDTVTLHGKSLDTVTDVRFNGTSAPFTVLSAKKFEAIVPFGATTGPITVTGSAGTSSTDPFRVLPKIDSFTPTAGGAGATVVITGTNLANPLAVRIRHVSVPVVSSDYTTLVVTVPQDAGTGRIVVTTADGTVHSDTKFEFIVSPKISDFTPTSGPVGSVVTINGTNLDDVTSVRFNTTPVTDPITVVSPTAIQVTVPEGATTGPISVTSPRGTAVSAGNFSVSPRIDDFQPRTASAGESVTITGLNFTGATSVQFGSVSGSFTVDSDTSIHVTVPLTASTAPIFVTTPDGTGQSATDFVVIKPPTITSFTPTSGPVGSIVTINGTNLDDVTSVRFNATPVTDPITVVSATSIRVTVPAGATTGKISVGNPDGTAVSAGVFRVLPRIDNFAPSSGRPGDVILITGRNFAGATDVRFGSVSSAFILDDDMSIRAIVPGAANTGPIVVMTPDGTAQSDTDFIVIKPPTISGFTPTSGPVGSMVTILGSNLDSVTNAWFNGVAVTDPIIVVSPTTIVVRVPLGATPGKISVANAAGTALSQDDFEVFGSDPTA